MDQWRAIIDHTEFPSAVFNTHGDLIGHYEGSNEAPTDWETLAAFATDMIKPFLEVDEDATYIKLDAVSLYEQFESSSETVELGSLDNLELEELYTPPDPMLNYFGYNSQQMLPPKKPNELRPWQLYAGMTEFQESNNIAGMGEQMLPTLLPGTKLPTPKAPDMSYFRKLNKTMTEDLMRKAEPWSKSEKDSVDSYIESVMESTGARPMGSLDAFHQYMDDIQLLNLEGFEMDFFDLYDFDVSTLPDIESPELEELEQAAHFSTELLNYDDDWNIFW